MEHVALEEETFAGPITWDFSPVKGMETYMEHGLFIDGLPIHGLTIVIRKWPIEIDRLTYSKKSAFL